MTVRAVQPSSSWYPLKLQIREGNPSDPTALFVVEINNVPTTRLLAAGSFDAQGGWVVSGTVPPGLTGVEVAFRSFALGFSGNVVDSSNEVVSFQ